MASIQWTTLKNAIATWILTASGLPPERLRWAGSNAPQPPTSSTLPWILVSRFTWRNPGSDFTQYETNPLDFAPKTATLDSSLDIVSVANHGLTTRDGPVRLTTTGSLAGTNLATDTDYWVIREDAGSLRLASSFLDADAGNAVDIQGSGTGVHALVSTPDSLRSGHELIERVRGARRVQFDIQCFPPVPALGQPLPDDADPISTLSDITAKVGLNAIAQPLAMAGFGLIGIDGPRQIDGVLNNTIFEPRAIMTVTFATTSEVVGTDTIIDYVEVAEDPGTFSLSLDFNVPANEP